MYPVLPVLPFLVFFFGIPCFFSSARIFLVFCLSFFLTIFCYFARSPETFCEFFFVFAWEFCIEKWQGFLVNSFWCPFPTKRSTKTPQKIRGKFGAKFGAKFGTKNRKFRGTFVLQLFWPNFLSLCCRSGPSCTICNEGSGASLGWSGLAEWDAAIRCLGQKSYSLFFRDLGVR